MTAAAAAQALRVLVADEDDRALRDLSACLHELGHTVTARAVTARDAAEAIAEDDPDVSIVMLHEDDDHALGLIAEAVEAASGPVIAISDGTDAAFVARAAEAGIDAYAGRLEGDAIQAALDLAIHHHRTHAQLVEQVDRLESALERRALIERAKGILMERHSVAEREAFELLRAHARRHSRRVVDVAASVAEGHGLLPARGDAGE